MPPPRDDHYISLSPTESPVEDADMESGAVALPALQAECQESRKGLTRLPADTPRTPGPKGVNFQQFCDRLRTDLPGDSQEEEVLIPVHGLSQVTLVPDSVILHL